MSWNNRVIWSEGMFLRPQHFQQEIRYIEQFVEGRCSHLRSNSWGFHQLKLDEQLLKIGKIGKIGISSASGVFPDGTPFNIPEDDDTPSPLVLSKDDYEKVIYLSLPVRRAGAVEVVAGGDDQQQGRYSSRELTVRDQNSDVNSEALVQVGKLRMRLLMDGDKRDDYTCLGAARVISGGADGQIVLDDQYIPSVISCRASSVLVEFMKELTGMLNHRGNAIASRVTASGRGGTAEITDFLLLQVVNRYEPLVNHLASEGALHPETLYRYMLELAGELATFTTPEKRPPEFPAYMHEQLSVGYTPVTNALRQSLSMVLEQTAISIPLAERKYGIHVAMIADRGLLDHGNFVFAISANLPAEDIRKRVPSQVKVGPVEKIRDLVNMQLPGIALQPLPVAPRQMPYHSGSVYFELDGSGDLWKELKTSGGIAVHLGGDFPGLEMELWAIRGQRS